MNEHER
jgi:hypothetical protein